jgi:rhodanese-related sulfurtransferase
MITRSTIPVSAALCFLAIAGCKRESVPSSSAPLSPPEVSLPDSFRELAPEEITALLQSKPNLQILDMRVETEWAEEGHLAGAHLINFFRANLADHLGTLERQKPYLVYCALGERARLTAAKMAESGFKEVYLLRGGFNAWKKAGLPITRG